MADVGFVMMEAMSLIHWWMEEEDKLPTFRCCIQDFQALTLLYVYGQYTRLYNIQQ